MESLVFVVVGLQAEETLSQVLASAAASSLPVNIRFNRFNRSIATFSFIPNRVSPFRYHKRERENDSRQTYVYRYPLKSKALWRYPDKVTSTILNSCSALSPGRCPNYTITARVCVTD